jgi:hypothetical protein
MQQTMKISDPWSRTVDLLTAIPPPREDDHEEMNLPRRKIFKSPRLSENTVVNLLDVPTERSVTVSWHDSTACHYGEQVWRVQRARISGVCALSRLPIKRGDFVYQPTGRPRPLNSGAMMLHSVVMELRDFVRDLPEDLGLLAGDGRRL